MKTPSIKYDADAYVGYEVSLEVRKRIDNILKQREEILTAFIAKYGYDPDKIEQITENTVDGMKWYVRKRIKS